MAAKTTATVQCSVCGTQRTVRGYPKDIAKWRRDYVCSHACLDEWLTRER